MLSRRNFIGRVAGAVTAIAFGKMPQDPNFKGVPVENVPVLDGRDERIGITQEQAMDLLQVTLKDMPKAMHPECYEFARIYQTPKRQLTFRFMEDC